MYSNFKYYTDLNSFNRQIINHLYGITMDVIVILQYIVLYFSPYACLLLLSYNLCMNMKQIELNL